MSRLIVTGVLLLGCVFALYGQRTVTKKKSVVFNMNSPKDSVQFKTPAHRQGVICNFEDQLGRKKVPLNFQLGNSKY